MRRRGFTLIELLIAMGMSAIIFVTVSSLLVTLLGTNTKSRRQEIFEQVKASLAADLSTRVRWGQEVNVAGGRLTVDGTVYEEAGGRLLRSGEPITPSTVRLSNLVITNLSGSDDIASLVIEADLEDTGFNLANDKFSIAVSQRRTRVGGKL